jgi:ubiquitin
MKKLIATVFLLATSSMAMAHGCPGEMKKIDAKLATTTLNAADATKVKDLRAKGEQQHKEGKHSESMASLAEAKKVLGL